MKQRISLFIEVDVENLKNVDVLRNIMISKLCDDRNVVQTFAYRKGIDEKEILYGKIDWSSLSIEMISIAI